MPIMDGIEATKLIRKKLTPHQMPIVTFTVNVMLNEILSYKKIGVNIHIGKPFEKSEFIDLVLEYCPNNIPHQ